MKKGLLSKLCICLALLLILPLTMLLTGCGHKHQYLEYSFDTTHHWQECIGKSCTEKQNYEEHTLDSNDICQTCGYGAVVSTKFKNTVTYFKSLDTFIIGRGVFLTSTKD